ncbi:MAG: D-alanine--D-alanine ligase [Flavisolibacter sp.]
MKKKIALVTGGFSGEAVISYKSATTIYNHLDKEKFEVYRIDIRPEGWFYQDDAGNRMPMDRSDFTIIGPGGKLKFDVVFIGMHGTPGEDGKLQGYLDMLELPYTACNAATSALTFNKRYTIAVAALAQIPVASSVHIFKDAAYSIASILEKIKPPLFVKPNNGGSSIGMSKVILAGDLEEALKKAFKEDDQVLVEEMIAGREFTVGVFKSKGQIQVLPITEVSSHKDFFDYEAKYEGKSTETTPALISESWKMELERTATKIYEIFNCRGVVRIDFIYNEDKKRPYLLEINTIPGQSDASVVPQQVRAMGWDLKKFYTELVEEALKNH